MKQLLVLMTVFLLFSSLKGTFATTESIPTVQNKVSQTQTEKLLQEIADLKRTIKGKDAQQKSLDSKDNSKLALSVKELEAILEASSKNTGTRSIENDDMQVLATMIYKVIQEYHLQQGITFKEYVICTLSLVSLAVSLFVLWRQSQPKNEFRGLWNGAKIWLMV